MASHQAGRYLQGLFKNLDKAQAKSKALTSIEASNAQAALKSEAVDHYFSSVLSFLEAINGPPQGLYSWATVKLYYSAFYSLRSILAIDNYCIFYLGTTCCSIKASIGEQLTYERGNTHETALRIFRRHNPNHILLSQQIGTEDPLDWLKAHRESASYGIFSEPQAPIHFEKAIKGELRKYLASYIEDPNRMFEFDPDHAIIAFPLALIRDAQARRQTQQIALNGDKASMLRKHCKDRKKNEVRSLVELAK